MKTSASFLLFLKCFFEWRHRLSSENGKKHYAKSLKNVVSVAKKSFFAEPQKAMF
jgi:hypothetical protein